MAPSPAQSEDGTDVFYSKFDAPLLAELVDMAEDIKDDNQTEIAFEPDTELEDITNWNKDDESKGSLHNMRTEKLHGKDDDEEKD